MLYCSTDVDACAPLQMLPWFAHPTEQVGEGAALQAKVKLLAATWQLTRTLPGGSSLPAQRSLKDSSAGQEAWCRVLSATDDLAALYSAPQAPPVGMLRDPQATSAHFYAFSLVPCNMVLRKTKIAT